jgi:hypothetical protein
MIDMIIDVIEPYVVAVGEEGIKSEWLIANAKNN